MIHRDQLAGKPWFGTSYPFTSRYCTVDGQRLHYVDEGTGPAVVFVHGTPSWSYEFRQLIERLRPTHRCLALDHLGFGLSDRPAEADYTLAAHTSRLQHWLQQLGVDSMRLVLHDFGGPIALPLALAQPQAIAGLVLGNTWAWPFERCDPPFARRKGMLDGFVIRWLYRYANLSARVMVKKAWGTHRPLTAAQHAAYLDMFPTAASRVGTVAFAAALAHDEGPDLSPEQARRLAQVPTLLVWGQQDLALKSAFLARWQQLMPGARCCLCPQAGHFVFDEAADVVAPAMEELFRS